MESRLPVFRGMTEGLTYGFRLLISSIAIYNASEAQSDRFSVNHHEYGDML